jgi:hypothetical protein
MIASAGYERGIILKTKLALILCLLSCFALSACSTTTITDKPGNYQYKVNETVNIVDIDSRESLGTVTVTGAAVLKDEPFEVLESDGTHENGETKYKTVVYNQIVQIFYTYTAIDSSKTISGANFDVRDSGRSLGVSAGSLTSQPDYSLQSRDGSSSFVVALKNKGDYLEIAFKYKVLQMKATALIRVEL